MLVSPVYVAFFALILVALSVRTLRLRRVGGKLLIVVVNRHYFVIRLPQANMWSDFHYNISSTNRLQHKKMYLQNSE